MHMLIFTSFRLEPHLNIKVWTSNGSSVGKEGDASQWNCVFFAPNCTLPKVKRYVHVQNPMLPDRVFYIRGINDDKTRIQTASLCINHRNINMYFDFITFLCVNSSYHILEKFELL